MRCLIVDDEHFALALLEKYVQQQPDLELVASCRSAVRAIEILQSQAVDLLLLDIQMPVLSGISLLRNISNKPVTIFTTAYPQHAHEAFDLDAVDYLLKPFSLERFEHALQKARAQLQLRHSATTGPEGFLSVKAERQWVKIPLSDILYIEGWKEYVKIFTAAEKIVTLESLNKLEQELPAAYFLRVHKSYIVAREKVSRLEGDALLIGAQRIPVARARKRAVVELLFP
ncbi:MAG: response regulator transcription factor [Saprospiraceae bacterium]|nr:response regulator transcription factor [Saprospiraceae bacterium]